MHPGESAPQENPGILPQFTLMPGNNCRTNLAGHTSAWRRGARRPPFTEFRQPPWEVSFPLPIFSGAHPQTPVRWWKCWGPVAVRNQGDDNISSARQAIGENKNFAKIYKNFKKKFKKFF